MFNDLLDVMCEQIRIWLPELKTCEPHGGRFDKKELGRISGRAPAVYVAVGGTGKASEVGTSELDIPVSFVAYIVAVDRPKLPKAVAALNIAEYLIVSIYNQQWGISDHVHPALPPVSKNLFTGELGRKGVALWAVTWQQMVRLGEDVWVAEYPMPSQLYLGMAPNIGEGHEDDYRLITSPEEGV